MIVLVREELIYDRSPPSRRIHLIQSETLNDAKRTLAEYESGVCLTNGSIIKVLVGCDDIWLELVISDEIKQMAEEIREKYYEDKDKKERRQAWEQYMRLKKKFAGHKICQECLGQGYWEPVAGEISICCPDCGGTGEIDDTRTQEDT